MENEKRLNELPIDKKIEVLLGECETVEDYKALYKTLADHALETNDSAIKVEEYIRSHYGEQAFEELLADALSREEEEKEIASYPQVSSEQQYDDAIQKMLGL